MSVAAIITGLRSGQGVEDIAIDLAMSPEDVRAVVRDLRKRGILPRIYEQVREEWRRK